MTWIDPWPQYCQDRPGRSEPWWTKRMGEIRGTIQRVNYERREVRVIAEGRAWRFQLAAGCRLWFNEAPAVLRCFHPLDPVLVRYQDRDAPGEGYLAGELYGWEPQPSAVTR